jgi:hypothetical protein
MTAEPSQNPVTEAVRSLKVRWIFPGQLETTVARWFVRFPATTESREDTYLALAAVRHQAQGFGAYENREARNPCGHALRMAAPVQLAGESGDSCLAFAGAGREARLVAGTGDGRLVGRGRLDPLEVDLVGGEQHADDQEAEP